MAKKELTLSEFREIIKEEALKLKKRIVLENEKKALMAELSTLMNESCGEELEVMQEPIEEILGFGKDAKAKKLQGEYLKYSKAWGVPIDQATMDSLMQKAAADNYDGAVGFDKNTKKFDYRPTASVKYQSSGFGGISGGPTAE